MTDKPETDKPDFNIQEGLRELKAANLRLRLAINNTVASWPNTSRCWIDSINGEPTALLEKHRIRNGSNGS